MDIPIQRSLTLIEIFLSAWTVFTKQFKNIALAVVIVHVPINVGLYFFPVDFDDRRSIFTLFRLSVFLYSTLGLIPLIAITIITERFLRSPEDNIRLQDVLKAVMPRWPFLLWSNFTTALILMGWSLLLIIPGIIFSIYYIFLVPSVILKKIYGAEARAYSRSLVQGQWWKTFLYTIVIVGSGYATYFALSISTSQLVSDIFSSLFIDTSCDIVQAFFEVAFVVFFLNLDYTKNYCVRLTSE